MNSARSARSGARGRTRPQRESVDYPANPFVALSDFLMVILMLVILGFVYESVSSNRLFERMAVEHLQKRLLSDMSGGKIDPLPMAEAPPADAVSRLKQAFTAKHFGQPYVDGDLQRFWLDGAILYGSDNRIPTLGGTKAGFQTPAVSASRPLLTDEGRRLLVSFGEVLRPYQGDLSRPGSGLFKRITIQGNADRSEGDDDAVWTLSLARAREAAQVLQNNAHISPLLIEASARGCWDPRRLSSDPMHSKSVGVSSPESTAQENRRLEIVVVYSAPRASQYEHSLTSSVLPSTR